LLGVYIHGLAGNIAAEEMTEIAMTASDIINALPSAWKKISQRMKDI
jgi:NAD(P)H-hydrate epimerase